MLDMSGGMLAWLCLGQGADLHMTQQITISCFSKSRLVLLSWFYVSGAGSPGWSRTKSKRAVKWCVCVCVFQIIILPTVDFPAKYSPAQNLIINQSTDWTVDTSSKYVSSCGKIWTDYTESWVNIKISENKKIPPYLFWIAAVLDHIFHSLGTRLVHQASITEQVVEPMLASCNQ